MYECLLLIIFFQGQTHLHFLKQVNVNLYLILNSPLIPLILSQIVTGHECVLNGLFNHSQGDPV